MNEVQRQHKQTAHKHHASPEKDKGIMLIDTKMSKFGAKNPLLNVAVSLICLTICVWFNIAVSGEYLVQRFSLIKSESLVYPYLLNMVMSVVVSYLHMS